MELSAWVALVMVMPSFGVSPGSHALMSASSYCEMMVYSLAGSIISTLVNVCAHHPCRTPGMEGRDILKSNIRLRHGLTLVRQGGLTVSEVAYKVGMSPKQFAKFFKEEYGSLPSKYV